MHDYGFPAFIGLFFVVVFINLAVYFIYRAPKLFLKGCRLHVKGEYAAAARCFARAMKLRPGSAVYAMARGIALDKLDERAEAGECFDRSVELDPGSYLAFAARGHHHCLTGDLEKAEADLLRSIGLKGGFFEPHYDLACVFSLKGDLPAARKYLEKTLELGYRDFDAIMNDATLVPALADEATRKRIEEYRAK